MINKRWLLIFSQNLVNQPITYQLVRKYDLMVNILRAKITPQEQGELMVEVSGTRKNLNSGIDFLSDLGVAVKPLAQQVEWMKERCIECTACTAMCTTGALSVKRPEMGVLFDREKCIACELCIPACPYGAILNSGVILNS